MFGVWKEGEFLSVVFIGNNSWYGCIEGDCLNGYGFYVFWDGVWYEGIFKNELFYGRGIVVY